MKNTKAVIISALLASIAVALVYLYIQQRTGGDEGELVGVYIMNKDIAELTTIDETMIRRVDVPKKFVQPNAVIEQQMILGRVTKAPLKKDEQILLTKLYFKDYVNLSREVAQGNRAVTVPVSDVHGVARLIQPGDRVDVIVSVDYGEGDRELREVKTVMQDVKVLATGQNVSGGSPLERQYDDITQIEKRIDMRKEQYRSVTVEAQPEDVQKLVFMMTAGEGRIFLSLRNPADREIVARDVLKTADEDTVLGPASKKGARIRMQRQPMWTEY
ncbi:MAG: Flp pilus assembly protein CpaB [Deltaproteobacteria bacterium]|nr:Flp pilus assembly protein CpaB [Deltaproteobacteria bacterium]